MKRFGLLILFNIIITISVLLAGTYVATTVFVDPAVESLADAVDALAPETRNDIMPHLVRLDILRSRATFYVPLAFCLAAVSAMILLIPFIRRARRERAVSEKTEQGKTKLSPKADPQDARRAAEQGALRLLAVFQDKGRLIDFLEEDINAYQDAQIGAAVRQIHQDCKDALHEHVTLAPVIPEQEGQTVMVPTGFDASEFRLTGRILGDPPYHGILQHSGWKVTRIHLPGQPKGRESAIIAPAEVEIGDEGAPETP